MSTKFGPARMAASRSGSSTTWTRRRSRHSPRAPAALAAAPGGHAHGRGLHIGVAPPLRSTTTAPPRGWTSWAAACPRAGRAARAAPHTAPGRCARSRVCARASRRGRFAPCSLWQRPREQAAKDVLSRLRGAVLVHGRAVRKAPGGVHEHGTVVGDRCGTAFVASHESTFGRGILRRSGMSAPMSETSSFMLALNCGKSVSASSPSV